MGRSLAQRLAAHGSPVAITDIDEQALKGDRRKHIGAGADAGA